MTPDNNAAPTGDRLQRAAGLILLGLAILIAVGALLSLNTAISRDPENGEAGLVALGRLGAVILGVLALVFLVAAFGVLRGESWGRRLGLALSGGLGAWLLLTLFSSPMPWDQSANLGPYQASAMEWLIGRLPLAPAWIAFAILTRKNSRSATP